MTDESSALAERTEAGGVPALASTPALEITAEDVALPKVKIGQFMSEPVQEGLVNVGDIFTSLGQDDPEPNVIYSAGDDEGVLLHVLSLQRGKSVSEDGELIVFDYDDPDAPADAWVTYNYVVVLPEVDQELPFKWLFTRTGKPAAQQMNMVLAKGTQKGEAPYSLAFRLTTAERKNKKGTYYIPRARHVEADEDNVAICEKIATMISPDAAAVKATGEEPAI